MIKFHCTHCGTAYKSDDNDAGQSFPCEACGRPMLVPLRTDGRPTFAEKQEYEQPTGASGQASRAPNYAFQQELPRLKADDILGRAEKGEFRGADAHKQPSEAAPQARRFQNATGPSAKLVRWRIGLAMLTAFLCYPLLSLVFPHTEAGAFLKMLCVIGIGVGLLRWAKRNSGALKSFRAEWIWIVIFAADGGLGIAAALYTRSAEKRALAAVAELRQDGFAPPPASLRRDGFAPPPTSDGITDVGLLLFMCEYDKVIRAEDEVIQRNPKDPQAYRWRGNAWEGKKEHDKAIRDYDEAIRLDPKDALIYFDRAYAWGEKKEYDKAIQDYEEVIRLNPKEFLAYLNRAWALEQKKQYDKAIKGYEQTIRLSTNKPIAYRYLALLLATCPERKFRDRYSAIETATKACELTDWKGGLELDALASCHFELGHLEEAIRYQTQATRDTGLSNSDRERVQQRLAFFNQRTFWATPAPDGLDVKIDSKLVLGGYVRGTVHNETGQRVTLLKLLFKTAAWERRYDVKVSIDNNSTSTFEVFIGDGFIEIKSFKVLD
jgi:tetratricopeptide (TPR) repeat protein